MSGTEDLLRVRWSVLCLALKTYGYGGVSYVGVRAGPGKHESHGI